MEYKDSWKNLNVFKKQLNRNKEEFNNYPQHWSCFVELLKYVESPINLLDIGCGCGSYYKLCKDNYKDINYFGIDYSDEAVDLAISEWKVPMFQTMNLFELTDNFLKRFNVIHMGALLDVLPNGDEALNFILSKKTKYVLIGRIDFTNNKSNYTVYEAYDEIKTYKYMHNIDTFTQIVSMNNYFILKTINNSVLLKLKEDI